VFAAAEHGYCSISWRHRVLAGCTVRLRLLASVLVVPHRAHANCENDFTSTCCRTVAHPRAGTGWMKEEFALLGAPFADRGKATDEYLEAFRELWTRTHPPIAAST